MKRVAAGVWFLVAGASCDVPPSATNAEAEAESSVQPTLWEAPAESRDILVDFVAFASDGEPYWGYPLERWSAVRASDSPPQSLPMPLFLDVPMPGVSGLTLNPIHFQFVFGRLPDAQNFLPSSGSEQSVAANSVVELGTFWYATRLPPYRLRMKYQLRIERELFQKCSTPIRQAAAKLAATYPDQLQAFSHEVDAASEHVLSSDVAADAAFTVCNSFLTERVGRQFFLKSYSSAEALPPRAQVARDLGSFLRSDSEATHFQLSQDPCLQGGGHWFLVRQRLFPSELSPSSPFILLKLIARREANDQSAGKDYPMFVRVKGADVALAKADLNVEELLDIAATPGQSVPVVWNQWTLRNSLAKLLSEIAPTKPLGGNGSS